MNGPKHNSLVIVRFDWLARRDTCFQITRKNLNTIRNFSYFMLIILSLGLIWSYLDCAWAMHYAGISIGFSILITKNFASYFLNHEIECTNKEYFLKGPAFEKVLRIGIVLFAIIYAGLALNQHFGP